MAWRDARRNWNRLLLFMTAIVLGIGVLTAINGFRYNLQADIDAEAKALLGADLTLRSYYPPDSTLAARIDTLGVQRAHSKAFATMVRVAKTGQTRLVQVRALEGYYPFYGSFTTNPENADTTFREGPFALVDAAVINQYNLQLGDSLQIGQMSFAIKGSLEALPGTPGVATTISPKVYIPMAWLESTGLIQKGSRVYHRYYFKMPESTDVDALVKTMQADLDAASYEYTTVQSNRDNQGEAFSNLTGFLNLVGFIALLLGAIGVAGTVQVYLNEKKNIVATLRCLGLRGKDAMLIYFFQVLGMSTLGSLIGIALGTLIQLGLPAILQDFVPVALSMVPSPLAMLQGFLTGLGMAALFAGLPLLRIRKIAPLQAIRVAYEQRLPKDPLRYGLMALIVAFIFGFTWWQIGDVEAALFFSGILAGGFLLLTAVGGGTIWAVRKFFPNHWPYVWRQGLANLYRPNNQTLILVITIGLGTALISILFFIRTMLLQEIELSGSADQPNVILFDIQPSQRDQVADFTEQAGYPVIQEVPIVTLRLEAINGRPREAFLADSTSEIPRYVFNREYRVTYRDTLIETETIVSGVVQQNNKGRLPLVTLEQRYAETMEVTVGDTLTFNLQGIRIKVGVGGIRTVDWRRVQTNFILVFPSGLLERAPQFYVLISRINEQQAGINFQQELVRQFPNVSVIDLKQILATAEEVLGKVSFVIQFMALFSIGTGLLILVSSLNLSKYQRIRESVLLRTLGATRRQILAISGMEYFLLGLIAATSGIVIGLIGAYAIAWFSFATIFVPAIGPPLLIIGSITGITVIIGLVNTRSIIQESPLAVLRQAQ